MLKFKIACLLACAAIVAGTALDDYGTFRCFHFTCDELLGFTALWSLLTAVWRPDPAYGWTDTGLTLSGKGLRNDSWTGYILNMTSQRWLTDADFANNSESKSVLR